MTDAAPAAAGATSRAVLEEIYRIVDSNLYIHHEYEATTPTPGILFPTDSSAAPPAWGAERDRIRALPDNADVSREARRMLATIADRYTRYLDPDNFAALTKFDATGIGILLTTDKEGLVVESPPLRGSSAAAANIRIGTRVLAIDGQDVTGLNAFQAAEVMRGENGSKIRLTLRALGDATEKDVELTRRFEVRDPVSARMETLPATASSAATQVGVIKMSEFNSQSSQRVRDSLASLRADGAQAFVLDLRGNHGGIFESALETAGLFIPPGSPVVGVHDRKGNSETLAARLPSGTNPAASSSSPSSTRFPLLDEPLLVLVDRESASSSEILAAALQDDCRAVIAGPSASYGKGLIQGVFGLPNGGGIIVTVAEYTTPRDRIIQARGVVPDVRFTRPLWGSGLARVDFGEVAARTKACKAEQL